MKKLNTILAVSTAALMVGLVGCTSGENILSPDYPLGEETVTSAIKELELPWTIGEVQYPQENTSVHILVDGNDKLVGTIEGITVTEGGREERSLNLTFPRDYGNDSSIKEDSWKDAINLATILYGQFKNIDQVYDNFVKEYDGTNTRTEPEKKIVGKNETVEGTGQVVRWEKKINDTICMISLYREYPNIPDRQNIFRIQMVSNLEVFFPDCESFN